MVSFSEEELREERGGDLRSNKVYIGEVWDENRVSWETERGGDIVRLGILGFMMFFEVLQRWG